MYPGQTVEPDTVMLVSQGQITAVLLLDSSSSFLSLFLPFFGFFCFFCLFCFPFLLFLLASRRGLLFFSSSFFFSEGFLALSCLLSMKPGSCLGLLLDLKPQTAQSQEENW